jgi:hypothetical protein
MSTEWRISLTGSVDAPESEGRGLAAEVAAPCRGPKPGGKASIGPRRVGEILGLIPGRRKWSGEPALPPPRSGYPHTAAIRSLRAAAA